MSYPVRILKLRHPGKGAKHEATRGDSARDFQRAAIWPRSTIDAGVMCRSVVCGYDRYACLDSRFGPIGTADRIGGVRRLARRQTRSRPADPPLGFAETGGDGLFR